MPRGRAKAPLVLGAEQRETLKGWGRRTTSAHGLARRARMVLGSAEGLSNLAVAERVGVTPPDPRQVAPALYRGRPGRAA